MNGKMLDEIEVAIQKVLDNYCEDEIRWPDSFCLSNISRYMANVAEVVF